MTFIELFILAAALSLDAFAVSISIGLTAKNITFRGPLTAGLYFGVFQAAMPVIGYFMASLFARQINAYDHWIAFVLLCFLGGRMIVGSLEKEESVSVPGSPWTGGNEPSTDIQVSSGGAAVLTPGKMLPFAIATSIDALAVGVTFAFLRVSIFPAVSLIGVTTFALSAIGVRVGGALGIKFKSKAEFTGGVVLALIGLKILLEHLEVIHF